MNTHRIHRVAKLTGLSRDVIRVWERRYGLVKPSRSANRYRIYSDEEVALLRYVKNEMDKGQSIGDLIAVGREKLLASATRVAAAEAVASPPYERVLHELVSTLEPLNRNSFERRLNGAVAVIPFEEALYGILLPLQTRVGQLWHDGQLGVAVEHYVTNQVRQKIFSAINHLPVHEQGPKVVVACPPEEFHEVGAQAVAYICASRGCRLYYLGTSMPTEDLLNFCDQVQPQLVLISIVNPPPELLPLTNALVKLAKPDRTILVGGASARLITLPAHASGVEFMEDLADLRAYLTALFAQLPARARYS